MRQRTLQRRVSLRGLSSDEPLVAWPGTIMDLMNDTGRQITTFGNEIAANRRIGLAREGTPEFSYLVGWSKFVTGWGQFYDDHRWYIERLSGSVWDQTVAYREQLIQWREKAKQFGLVSASPTPDIPKDGGFGGLVKPLLWGLGIVAGIVIVPKILDVVKRR